MEIFVFTDNLFFESVLYKGISKSLLLFEIVLCIHQVQMKGELIIHIVNIAGTRMIEAGIDGLYIVNNLGGVMRDMEPFQFVPLGKVYTKISDNLVPWLRYLWVGTLTPLEAMGWFEE